MVENIEAGQRFISQEFGQRAHIGWQLDPFGHSAYTPSVLKRYGFDSLFITRVGTMIKDNLRSEGHLKFIWRGHDKQEIFVSVS